MYFANGMLNPIQLRQGAEQWINEDVSSFDVGGAVVGESRVRATFFGKSDMVVAGYPFAEAVLHVLGCSVKWSVPEGTRIAATNSQRTVLGVAEGPANRLLQAERTALEVLTRCSACATYARQCVDAVTQVNSHWKGRVAATRKTSPGFFREVEKYGSIVGGADPHRYNLSSMVMLKDNHIDVAGSITKAVTKARALCGFSVKIEVECRSVEDALEASAAGADVVMLDNFSPAAIKQAIPRLRSSFPAVLIEVSGGVKADTVGKFAIDGVDIVSVGMITHGPPPVDISLKITTGSKL